MEYPICYIFISKHIEMVIEKGKLLVRVGHKTKGPRQNAAGLPVTNNPMKDLGIQESDLFYQLSRIGFFILD